MENNNAGQYDTLLNKSETFELTKKELQTIVSLDNIVSLKSYELIERLGGIKGLCEKLEVNPSRGLVTEDFIESKITKSLKIRRSHFGQCIQINPDHKSFLRCLFEFINQKLILFLLIIATVKMIINQLYQNQSSFDYISIYLIVFILTVITAVSNYLCENLFWRFQAKINQHEMRIMRNQIEKIVPLPQIMVGDIAIVASGDITLVDGIVIKTCGLSIESSIGDFQKINNLNYINNEQYTDFPIILSGTKVIKGYGLLLVLNVENNNGYRSYRVSNHRKNCNSFVQTITTDPKDFILTTANREYTNDTQNRFERKYSINESLLHEDYQEIEKEINSKDNHKSKSDTAFINLHSPIKQQLSDIYSILTKFGFVSGIIIGIVYIITQLYTASTQISILTLTIDCLFYVFVILIIAIPSGVELVTSLPLAFSIYKMLEEKTIVKKSAAYEYMAGVNYICTDYYGILTKNAMEIDSIFIEETQITKNNIANIREVISEEMFSFFCESISVNTIAFTAEKNGEMQCFGDNIECCLIKYLISLNVNFQNIRNYIYRPIIASSPYQSESKLSYTIIRMEDKWDYVRLYVKGTPDNILSLITTYINPGLVPVDFSQVEYGKIKMKSDVMVTNCIYPLIMCYRDIPVDVYQENEHNIDNLIKDLTFINLIGIKDDIKEDVGEYINDCKRAGIQVKLITSQEKKTAKLIAKKCGLIETNQEQKSIRENNIIDFINSDESLKKKRSNNIAYDPIDVIDAKDDLRKWVNVNFDHNANLFTFNVSNYTKFSNSIDQSAVIANATAKDKFILVGALLKKGACVAVTGEGLSDSIPMRAAHVGISMGASPNDIAKASSDIILSDNNFKAIVTAIVYGRNIYDCVRKYLQFQISTITTIVLIAFIMASPFFNITFYHNQLLFINLIINALQSIALSSSKPQKDVLLNKSPEEYSLHRRLISKRLFIQILIQAIVQLLILITLLQFAPKLFNITSRIKVIPNTGVKTQLTIIQGLHSTIIFNTIVFMIVFNAIISNNFEDSIINQLSHLSNHKTFIFIQCLIILIQFILIEFCGFITKTERLSLLQYLGCFLFASLILIEIPLFNYFCTQDLMFDTEEDMSSFTFQKLKEDNDVTANHIKINITEVKDEEIRAGTDKPKMNIDNLFI